MKSLALRDPASVRRELKKFTPTVKHSSKVVDLRDEACKLKLDDTPIAFCFLLRSMFELSVRDYCSTHKLPTVEPTKAGTTRDKSLADLLVDSANHLSAATKDAKVISELKVARTEIKNPLSVLSISSLNGLVHASTTTITTPHIVSGFHKILPLLIHLNK